MSSRGAILLAIGMLILGLLLGGMTGGVAGFMVGQSARPAVSQFVPRGNAPQPNQPNQNPNPLPFSPRGAQPGANAVNGAVVASEGSAAATERLDVDARIEIRAGSWIAARARSPFEVRSGFATSMAAHSSPVYLDVRDHPITADDDARAILAVIEGTLRWIGTMATVATEDDRRRMLEVIEGSACALCARRASWHGRIG